MAEIRNIGIFAHVDGGKTTLSEQLLLRAGSIRTLGSVDAGTAHTDTLPVERQRGISVKATCVSLRHRDLRINLIDTPGHADFSAEIERSLWALDAAVLVVCSVEGIQAQTEVLFEALREQRIPVIFFLNKTDRVGADPGGVLKQIRGQLTDRAVFPEDEETVCELLCDSDDTFLERYLSGESFPPALLRQRLGDLARKAEAYPVLMGSALRGAGVEALLDAIGDYTPEPQCGQDLCGVVFAAQQDKTFGRGVWIRLFGGTLRTRDPLELPAGLDPATGQPRLTQSKVAQIFGTDGKPVPALEAGDIGLVYGLGKVPIGHILGDPGALPRTVEPGRLRTPLITVRVTPERPEEMQALRQACDILSGEDPLLRSRYISSLNQLQLQAMGTIQLEILRQVLLDRFGLRTSFSEPAVIYRETIRTAAEGFVDYTMPKPCWAILRFRIEPGPRGSGVRFASQVPVRDIMARYQHQVEQAIPLALNQGRLGWQVTDVRVTLTGGCHHLEHTHPLDFIVATPMAIQDGLERGGSVLLEPILEVRFRLPAEAAGRVISDVNAMRGEMLDSVGDGDRMLMRALVPVRTSLDYAVTLAAVTGGRGTMTAKLHSYRECPLELGTATPRRNVDPLDKSKYILAARSALEGGIFDME